jgi:hypothetical protein
MTIKKTLLQIVKDILTVLDSDDVNSLADSLEASAVAEVVESTYYDIISMRSLPEHKSFVQLVSASDNDFPTHFTYPSNSNSIEKIWYDTSDDETFEYTEVTYLEPLEFIEKSDRVNENYILVDDKAAGTKIRVRNNKQPKYYTSFDDDNIVMDSYDATVNSTLTSAKSRAFGLIYPAFDRYTDTFVPDLDADKFPYLISEAKSRAMDIYKGGASNKVEQAARRNKSATRNKSYKTTQRENWNDYGR